MKRNCAHRRKRQARVGIRILALAIIAVAWTVGFLAYGGSPAKPLWWLFLVWMCLPYGIIIFVEGKVKKGKTSMVVILCTLFIVAFGGLYVQLKAMLDAQGGIILLFLPFYQLIAVGIGAAVAGVLRRD
jgi:FtsH-binding integral membrane protein